MLAHRTQGDIGRGMAKRCELGHSPNVIDALRLYQMCDVRLKVVLNQPAVDMRTASKRPTI
jgi:hypothetical protein